MSPSRGAGTCSDRTNPRKFPTTASRRISVAACLALIVLSISVGWWQYNASASELGTLDDATLHKKALVLAHKLGLKGKPYAEKMTRMTLAESEKPLGGELGKDAAQFGLTPDMPMFVYSVRGVIEATGVVEYPSDQPPPKYDRILLILNARNGHLITRGYIYAGASLPTQFEVR